MNERMREKQKSSITQGCVEVGKSDYIDHISAAAVSETFRKTCITHHSRKAVGQPLAVPSLPIQ